MDKLVACLGTPAKKSCIVHLNIAGDHYTLDGAMRKVEKKFYG
jgi:hypothetical protein